VISCKHRQENKARQRLYTKPLVFFQSRAQGVPWYPKDSTSQKPGQGQKRLNRWLRSLRDHNHLGQVF